MSSINNIAELQEVDDTLMPKPQETALHSTQKITNTIKTHQILLRNLIQNFLYHLVQKSFPMLHLSVFSSSFSFNTVKFFQYKFLENSHSLVK